MIGLVLVLAGFATGGVLYAFWHFGQGLPDYRQLATYEPPVMTRVHAGDGRLLAEFAVEKRVFVPVNAMPRRVIEAFLAAEDKNFFSHPGVDVLSVVRAGLTNIRNMGSNRRPIGASTITQQVAKNFLLTNEVSWERKVKEAILAFRIERAFTKWRILELYLNEIYLGYGSYGVAAAALNYFNKTLDDLTLAEAAYLAALPKAPNNYHPVRQPEAARSRRDWVVGRMLDETFVTEAEAREAQSAPVMTHMRDETELVSAPYFAEEVRRQVAAAYGERQLYQGGLSVRTTLDPKLQSIGERVLRSSLEDFDRKHGFRGPLLRLETLDQWQTKLGQVEVSPAADRWQVAVVLAVSDAAAEIGFADGLRGQIPLANLTWARAWQEGETLGPRVRSPSDVLKPGDVVLVERSESQADGSNGNSFVLRQVPEIQGGLVALDPHTGRVLALVGGYDHRISQFNRATQAQRQPGSSFKPFVYMAALDAGYSPSTIILDAPFVIDQGPGLPKWRPSNYSDQFYGPSTMRLGIEKSRNLMTVRLAQAIGMERVATYAERFGVVDTLPRHLSMSLGAGETTLMRLTSAYAMLVNGGKRITPTLIDRIQDRNGRTIARHDRRLCPACGVAQWVDHPPPRLPDDREQVADPASAYQMVSMLQGVVERGTARRVSDVGKPLAGKTGTTNDSLDAWFVGFSPDLAVGVFVGFDEPRSLGRRETGGSVAAPIFHDFMVDALAGKPAIPFRIPPGVRLVRVDAETGRPAGPGDRNVILEAFKADMPAGMAPPLVGQSRGSEPESSVEAGGLY
jgi:penicillin-binding protein 1A